METKQIPQPEMKVIASRLNDISKIFNCGKVLNWIGPQEHKGKFAKIVFDTEKEQNLKYVYNTENLNNF